MRTRPAFPEAQADGLAAVADVAADGPAKVHLPAARADPSPACQPPSHLPEEAQRYLLEHRHVGLLQRREVGLGKSLADAGSHNGLGAFLLRGLILRRGTTRHHRMGIAPGDL